jgi:long-chain acyl-CoA synthetase
MKREEAGIVMRLYDRTLPLRKYPHSLTEIMEITAQVVPERTALIHEQESISFATLLERMKRLASFLRDRGIQPGDRIALQVDNRPEFAYITGGVLMSGAVLVAMNVMYLEDEIRYILQNSGARVLFTIDALAGRALAVRGDLPALEDVIVIGGSRQGCTAFETVASWAPGDEIRYPRGNDLALLQYTSGTTGRPKGAMLTHKNVVSCLDMMANVKQSRLKEGDVVLLVLPLFHCYGLILGLFGCTTFGSTTVLVNRFDPVEIFRLFEKHRVTVFYGAPPMYVAFVNAPGLDKFDISSLERCGSGAAPLPVAVLERFRQLTGVEITEGYGLTESSPTICTNANAEVCRPGTVGKALPQVEVRIVDHDGRDVAPGEIGELVARGDNIFVGYWNNEPATREALRDGWFYTGDMARMDENGYFSIVDRKKDMVIVSGYNVYPVEVENELFRHAGIADVAVIAVPDPYQGESVMAVIVPRAGAELTEEEVIAFLKARLATFKVPKHVAFVDSLPKNRTGKVLKRVLREQFRRVDA